MRPFRQHRRRLRGLTMIELVVAMAVMGAVAYTTSLIYFSAVHIYNQRAWSLPPFDEATRAVQRLNKEIRGAMLVHDHADTILVVVNPLKDANRDNVLTLGDDGYVLAQGDLTAYYLSDATGALEATGNCLWKAVKAPGATEFVPTAKIADNIHPELNPIDPATGLARPMFRYWPDNVRVWGVEVWVTSTSVVHGQTRPQTVHSEIYLRNL